MKIDTEQKIKVKTRGSIAVLLKIASYAWVFGLIANFALAGVVWYDWRNLKQGDVLAAKSLDWLAVCVAAEFAAFAFERLIRKFEVGEANALRTELELTKKIAEMAKRKTDRRLLSEAGKRALRELAAKYPKQLFRVYGMRGDEEAVPFAMQIEHLLAKECGWFGGMGGSGAYLIQANGATGFAGLGITCGPKNGNVGWAFEIIRELYAIFEADGIESAHTWTRLLGAADPTPDGTIEINVGRRPA